MRDTTGVRRLCMPIYTATNNVNVQGFPSPQHLALSVFLSLAYHGNRKWYITVDLFHVPLMSMDLSTCVLANQTTAFVNFLFQSFAHFYFQLFVL